MMPRGVRLTMGELIRRLRCLVWHRGMWKVTRYLPLWTQWFCRICGCTWTYWRE
jgi:hypothetical protein